MGTVATILLALFGCAVSFILLHSLGMAYLSYQYRKHKPSVPEASDLPKLDDQMLPNVTVQLPIFNEKYVIERLIDVVAGFDYPQDKFEIQILDDSTDDTSQIVANKVKEIAYKGFQISHVQRNSRDGFKAGALKYGTEQATGELIAIFDADFIPASDFLRKTVPYFADEKLGLVQTRWSHLNANYSLLTRAIGFALDFHFSVEQVGRNMSGHLINFNGTAGIWRKSAILDAGGWESDTLTEDLDLSYRAQLRDWKLKFREEIISPAELPVTIGAIKTQQFRWMKGGAENARKNLQRVFSSRLSLGTKLTATVHLLSSLITVSICYMIFSSAILLFMYGDRLSDTIYYSLSAPLPVISLLYLYSYWVAFSERHDGPKLTLGLQYIGTFLSFAALFMSLTPHLSRASLEGVLRIKSPFVRTPKLNITKNSDKWLEKLDYAGTELNLSVLIEILAACILLAAMAFAFSLANYSLMLFFALPASGFIALTFYNFHHGKA
jgi:cellulose synthase/poly-beta-1,6-N-acetylglucosamine synthase-like glycosyltransferase